MSPIAIRFSVTLVAVAGLNACSTIGVSFAPPSAQLLLDATLTKDNHQWISSVIENQGQPILAYLPASISASRAYKRLLKHCKRESSFVYWDAICRGQYRASNYPTLYLLKVAAIHASNKKISKSISNLAKEYPEDRHVDFVAHHVGVDELPEHPTESTHLSIDELLSVRDESVR